MTVVLADTGVTNDKSLRRLGSTLDVIVLDDFIS
jgi:hypothetical protein